MPGGGIEDHEDLLTALRREIREEVGCEIKIVDEIGICLEYIGDFNLISISYVYVADKIAETTQRLTAEEMDAGFVLEWHAPQDVFVLIKNANATNKRGGQQMQREKLLLEYYYHRQQSSN